MRRSASEMSCLDVAISLEVVIQAGLDSAVAVWLYGTGGGRDDVDDASLTVDCAVVPVVCDCASGSSTAVLLRASSMDDCLT